jgi:hypothetical protein
MGRVLPGLPKPTPGLKLANAFSVKLELHQYPLTVLMHFALRELVIVLTGTAGVSPAMSAKRENELKRWLARLRASGALRTGRPRSQ